MNDPIIVIDAEKRNCRALSNLLEAHGYRVTHTHSLAGLPSLIHESSCRAVILDLDTVPVENRDFRDLKRKYPVLNIVAVSARALHPELREAIANYIYACVSKPVDPDELIYLVKSIFCAATSSEDRPEHNEWNAIR